jgi:hypothetical protein
MKTPTYHLGICMAGAVSAGAYTAGVMDYLIEALDNWEKAKKSNDPSVPKHNVVIHLIGGASAGGITSIISGIALQSEHHPVINDLRRNKELRSRNPLFQTWVNLTENETGKSMMEQMLDVDDIKRSKAKSLLNSDFIEKIARRAIKEFELRKTPRAYVDEKLEVFVTLSNLVGIPYRIGFNGTANVGTYYDMTSFRDFGHFCFAPAPLSETAKSGKIYIDGKNKQMLETLRQCGMATGAFPFGLAYRTVERPLDVVKNNNVMLNFIGQMQHPQWEKLALADTEKNILKTFNVDGGLMNNEPFEIVEKLLEEKAGTKAATWSDYKTTNAGIIMIDPFPCEDEPADWSSEPGLGSLAGRVYNTMRGQLLFKPADINKAYSSTDASRFMIVPSRDGREGYKAIACGAMGGFGGFMHFDFRYHDYFLGRRNCQKFLRDVFTIHNPMSNHVMAYGYADQRARDRYVFREEGNTYDEAPIIPDMYLKLGGGNPQTEVKPTWPSIEEKEIDKLEALFRKRYKAVLKSSIDLSWMQGILLGIGYKVMIGGWMTGSTIKYIKKQLRSSNLLK